MYGQLIKKISGLKYNITINVVKYYVNNINN
jgi:hypothetical protein